MKTYTVQKGDTLSSIAEQFRIKNGASLRIYHNSYCPLEDLLDHDVVAGKEILIPEDPKYLKQEETEEEPSIEEGDEGIDEMSDEYT